MTKRAHLLAILIGATLAITAAHGGEYQTDRGTINFLRYNLVSGGEITFPPQAVEKKLQGSGFFLMRLRSDGNVESVSVELSSGSALLDDHVVRLLKRYRFRPGTKQPIQWLVDFMQPGIVIVKIGPVFKIKPIPPRPKSKASSRQ